MIWATVMSSLNKVFWSELDIRLHRAALDLLGPDAELTAEAAEAIARYPWPGNVRELKHALAVARVVAGPGVPIDLAHLPAEIAAPPAPPTRIDDAERAALVRALAEAGGNVTAAARALGVARSTVHRMKTRFGI